MSYEEKVVGAKCENCDEGKYVKNPKTGKVFCDKKCWTSGQPSQSIPSGQFLTITQFNEQLDKMRLAFSQMQIQIRDLSSRLEVAEQALDEVVASKELYSNIPIVGSEKI